MTKIKESGYDRLWRWFSLSYASWLTIPRVMMHDMPDEWQYKMAELLEEYEDTFVNMPNFKTYVQLKDSKNKFCKSPEYLTNYRHPQRDKLDWMKKRET